jgi:hypothetical protein
MLHQYWSVDQVGMSSSTLNMPCICCFIRAAILSISDTAAPFRARDSLLAVRQTYCQQSSKRKQGKNCDGGRMFCNGRVGSSFNTTGRHWRILHRTGKGCTFAAAIPDHGFSEYSAPPDLDIANRSSCKSNSFTDAKSSKPRLSCQLFRPHWGFALVCSWAWWDRIRGGIEPGSDV